MFRHTHDSMFLNADTNWKELQVRMGYKSMSTTMDTYAELAPQRKLEEVSIYLDKIAEITLTAFTGIKISLHLCINTKM